MWVLIIILVSNSYGQAHVASVPGFKSEAACQAAAKAIYTEVPKADAYQKPSPVLICARQD